jgi:hypothetical protein
VDFNEEKKRASAFVLTSVPDTDPNLDPDPHIFYLPDPDPNPLVRGVDLDLVPAPDPSIIKQNSKKLDSYCFVTSFGLFIFDNDK